MLTTGTGACDLGREVRQIHARFVRPFVKSTKNDARDAEAIREALRRGIERLAWVEKV